MKLDETTKEIVINIHNTLAKEGILISIQEITDIVESQFIVGNLAFKKGIEIRLPLFGKFVRKHGLEKSKAAAKLNELKNVLTKEDFERKTLEAKLFNKDKNKKRKIKRKMTKVTFTKLKKTKNLVEVKNKYDKLL